MIRPVALAVTCAAIALAVAGCGGGTPGTASPDTSTTGAATTTSSAPAQADVDPCTLLSASDVSQIGITVASTKTHPDPKTTAYEWAAHSGAPSLGVNFHPGVGMTELNNSLFTSVTKITVNGRETDEASTPANNVCSVNLPITQHSSVTVIVSGKLTGTGACGWAEQMAKIVAPKVQTS